ncbi:hypothetical protein FRC06_010122, partial [Ceratobasidium sp. 370]
MAAWCAAGQVVSGAATVFSKKLTCVWTTLRAPYGGGWVEGCDVGDQARCGGYAQTTTDAIVTDCDLPSPPHHLSLACPPQDNDAKGAGVTK